MKRKCLNVIPECYVDTNLVEYLIGTEVNHQHSCTKVISLLNVQFRDRFAVGIIDRDKRLGGNTGYIKECDEIAATEHLSLYRHRARNQYLITVSPAADGFILESAANERIDTLDFGLPSLLKAFTKESKSVTSNKDTRFRDLFRSLRNNREFRNLGASLKYLVENEYQTVDGILIGLFTAP